MTSGPFFLKSRRSEERIGDRREFGTDQSVFREERSEMLGEILKCRRTEVHRFAMISRFKAENFTTHFVFIEAFILFHIEPF